MMDFRVSGLILDKFVAMKFVPILLVLFYVIRGIYRLYFHPLANIRGPKAAALSSAWAYRLSREGSPEPEIERLHKEYDTKALRIGPNEVHVSDVGLYKVIYSQTKPFLKDPHFYNGFNSPHSVFSELDRSVHKDRRRLLNPLFSKATTFKLEPAFQSKIQLLQKKLRTLSKIGPVDLYDGFRCLTTEVIMEFAFAKSAGMIEESPTSFHADFLGVFDLVARSLIDVQYWPVLRLMNYVPQWILMKIQFLRSTVLLRKFAADCLQHYQQQGNTTTHPVIFDNLTSLSDFDMVQEAMIILIAGADTTAATMTTAVFHILSNPKIEHLLIRELRSATPNNEGFVPLIELEKMEYLVACVKEAMRVGIAVPGRLPRVVPASGLTVDGQFIPEGTVVGMSAYTMNFSEEVWGAEARLYKPERWLEPNAKELDQHMCTFSKGARNCIGQNIAMAEATQTLAYVFRHFNMALLPGYRPETRDQFTLEFCKPGLPVRISPVQ